MRAKLVCVEWVDSHSIGEWAALLEEFDDTELLVVSVGWLVGDGEFVKSIASHVTQQDHPLAAYQARGLMFIPTCCIKRIITLPDPQ